ncbi:hypothetical protein [Desulfoluna sp.]|uniref:hypothetical protein n=1 Tax=Desulfoluna sp. TaxID=2045199 RepID=UPI002609AA22|nr:hypothetical protein [Desulfoluna sp.]
MLKIQDSTLSLSAEELIELERIMMDKDRDAAYLFLKKKVYRKLEVSVEGRMKSHIN